MSRRFNDEPINLIRRIPSPEQLDAARPLTRSLSEKFGEAAVSFARSVAERLARVTSSNQEKTATKDGASLREDPDDMQGGVVAEQSEPPDQEVEVLQSEQPWSPEAAANEPGHPAPVASSPVQPEELAELRGYLLKQQQDIVRLAMQIQELRSLVISQQQLIEYLGKEVAAGSVSLFRTGITSAVAKQSRPARQKPIIKEKAVVSEGDPLGLPLNV